MNSLMPLIESHFSGRAVTHLSDTLDEEEMAKYPGLYQRTGAWYVRKRTPVDLVTVEPRSQIRLSLDTAEKKTALLRYHSKMSEIDRHFGSLRNGLQSRGTAAAALATGRLERLDRPAVDRLVSQWWAGRVDAGPSSNLQDLDIADALADLAADARILGARPGESEEVRSVADQLLVAAGAAAKPHRVGSITTEVLYPKVDRSTETYSYLCNLVGRALGAEIALAQDSLLRRQDAPYDPLFNPTGSRQRSVEANKDLTDLFGAFEMHKRAEAASGKVTDFDKRYGFPFRVLAEVLGDDKVVASITRSDCLAVRRYFERVPPNAKKRFPGLSLPQAVAFADQHNLPRLAPNSVASYMQTVLAVLRWAEDEQWGIKVNPRGVIGSREATVKRRGFAAGELRKLFDGLGQFRETEPDKFWVPALALFTGARLGEICQLKVQDIVEVEDILCLNLSLFDADGRRVEDKRLKTASSERFVPVHPHLIAAGFRNYIDGTDQSGRLFPRLEKGPDDRYSHGFSKWFGRFKRSVGFNEPALVFHSFRHGFRDACRRADLREETAHALGG